MSRLSGMFRDMAMAFCFGSHPAIAAFMVAFRLANLMRRLFGEGSLSSGFIPHFETLRTFSLQKGAEFFRDFFHSLSIFLIAVILFFEGLLFSFVKFGHLSSASEEIIVLTMLMLPGLLFICLFGLGSALLQCEKNFFLAGFAPVAFNIIWILAAFYLKDQIPSSAVMGLSIAVVIAFFMQWAMTLPKTFQFLKGILGFKNCLNAKLFSPELREVVKPLFLGIIGVGAVQINSALDGIFARFASLEGPAYLWYAIRIEQLPLALFGIALSSALLPPLSRAMKKADLTQFLQLLHFSFIRSFSLIMPCTIGILVLGASGLNLLYGRGDFSIEATVETLLCLWGYGAGLIPSTFVLLLAPAFFAQKNYKVPTLASVYSVLFNILLNVLLVFVFHWNAASIALATSAAAFINCYLLARALEKKMEGPLFPKEVLTSFGKVTLCSSLAGATTLLLGNWMSDPSLQIMLGEKNPIFARSFLPQATQFGLLSASFILQFFIFAFLFKAHDALAILGMKKKLEGG